RSTEAMPKTGSAAAYREYRGVSRCGIAATPGPAGTPERRSRRGPWTSWPLGNLRKRGLHRKIEPGKTGRAKYSRGGWPREARSGCVDLGHRNRSVEGAPTRATSLTRNSSQALRAYSYSYV